MNTEILEWKDATNYKRDKERVQTSWELKLGRLRIWIGNSHMYNPGVFTMHCFQLGFDTIDLKVPADKLESAKIKAIKICLERAKEHYMALENYFNQPTH